MIDFSESYKNYINDIIKYHFENFYGMESDPKKHETYWRNFYFDCNKKELTDIYETLMQKSGSLNSNEIGQLNAVIWLLDNKYEDWRNR